MSINADKFKIRKAKIEDREKIVLLELIASRSGSDISIYDELFGNKKSIEFLEMLYDINSIENNPCHFSSFIVGEVNGEIAGALCTYVQTKRNPLFSYRIIPVLLKLKLRISDYIRIIQLLIIGSRVEDKTEDGNIVIEHVAVFPQYRGKGIAEKLIRETLANARRQGFKKANISVMSGNIAARNLYEKVGFKVIKENKDSQFEDIFKFPGMDIMEAYI